MAINKKEKISDKKNPDKITGPVSGNNPANVESSLLLKKDSSIQIYKSLIDNSTSAIILGKANGQIIEVNSAAEKIFGYSKKEFLKLGSQGIIDHSDEDLQMLLAQRKETGKARGELTGIKKTGEKFPIEFTSSIFNDHFGEEFTCNIIQDITERKNIEQQMLLMLNNTDESFILLDKELIILNFNKQFNYLSKKLFDVTVENGRHILEYAQPKRVNIANDIFKKVLKGEVVYAEMPATSLAGIENYFAIKYTPSKDSSGDLVGIFITIRDITDEKKSKAEIAKKQVLLEQAEANYREIFENANDAVFIHDLKTGKIIEVNKKGCELFGKNKKEILSADLAIFFTDKPGYTNVVFKEKLKKAAEGPSQLYESITRHSNGTLNCVEISLHKATIAGTERILANYRLINDRKNAEAHADIQRRDNEALINTTDDLIWSIDRKLKLIAANSAYFAMVGNTTTRFHQIGDVVLIDEFGEVLNNKWNGYYNRALAGEMFTIEEEYFDKKTKKLTNSLISFNPIYSNEKIAGVACYSKNITELTENQRALQINNADLDYVMASSLDMICSISKNNKIKRISAASERILGYKPEELIGKNLFDFIYPEDQARTKEIAEEVMGGKINTNFYNRYVRKDGSLVYLEWTSKWNEQAKMRYGVGRDVSAKVEAERKLKLSHKRYRSLVQEGADMITVFDAEAKYIYASPNTLSVMGYTNEDFTENTVYDFIHADDVEQVRHKFNLLKNIKKITLTPFRFKHKNGNWRWIETTLTNLMDEESINGIVSNARDVTERKNIEEALLVTKENYKNLFENSPAPMFIFDFETLQIIDCNIETLLKYGYTKEEFLQLTIKDIRPQEDINKIEAAVSDEKTYGAIHKNVWRHKKKNGEIMYMDISAHLMDYDGRRVSVLMLIDVTEKLKLEEQSDFERRDKEALINNTEDLIWSVSKNFKLLAANNAYIKSIKNLTGIIQQSGNDVMLEEHFPKPFLDFWKRCYIRAFNGENFKEELFAEAYRNRSERWLEINFNPIFNGTEITGVACNARNITENKKAEEKIKHSHERYEHVTKATYDAIWEWDIEKNTIYRADGFERSFGFNLIEINSPEIIWENFIHEEDRLHTNESIQSAIKSDKNYWSHEYRLIKPNGEQAYVEDRAYILRNAGGEAQRVIGALRDITERKYYHDLEILEREVLEKNAKGENSLEDVIEKYIVEIQKLHPGMICSMQKLEHNRLYNLSSPDLPKEFLTAINGIEIGNNVGSCGTAAFLKEKIIVTDIATDVRWAKYKDTALNAGLKACWSYPIFDSKNNVIATFAIYYQKIKTPTAQEENTINRAGNILQTILESYHREAALFESNQRYLNVTKATFDAIWDWDIASNEIYWGETYSQLFGNVEDSQLSDTDKVIARLHPDERDTLVANALASLEGTDLNWAHEHRYLRVDNTYAYVLNKALIVRDESGIATRVFGAMQDITQQKKEEQRLILMSSVVTSTNDAVLITEAEPFDELGPKIVFVNEAFTKMTGYTVEELIGQTPRIFQGPKTDKDELRRLKHALKKWQPCDVTIINYKKNGEEFWNNFTVSPVADEKGWYTHWISVERDVTECKNDELQKELLRKIRIIFNAPIGINETMDKVLKEVTLFGHFSFAESWLLSADKKEIKRATYYVADATMRSTLNKTSKLNVQKKGEGLVGTAWETQELQVWEGDKNVENILDEHVLINAGVKKLYALPFSNNAEIIGVIVFGLDKPETTTLKLENLFYSLRIYLGAEIKRKQLEQELSQIFNFAPDIIAIVGKDGFFKKLNPAASDLLEYSSEELMGVPFIEFIHPEDKNKTVEEFNEIKSGKTTFYFENRYIAKSGKIKWLAWTSTPSQEEEVIFAVGKNITEKKDLEVVLDKANTLARIGSWELDLEKNSLYWSDMTREIHEASSDYQPTVETAMHSYKEGKNRDEMIRRVEEAIEKGIAWDVELKIITENGNERWIRSIGETEFVNGKCVKLYGSLQDINERKRAEENIRSSEERRELIMNAALDAIICIDKTGNVTFWNPQAESIFGWTEREVMGKNLTDIIVPLQYKARHENGMQNYFKTGTGQALNVLTQFSALRKNGEEFPIELTVLPIEQNGEKFFCGFVRDITERKISETRLLELNHSLKKQTLELAAINKELEQFAYVASHDLQEPLRMVTSFITQLEKRYENVLDEKGKKYIYFAVDGASRMRQIILDLLEYSKIGRIDELKENIDLNKIVEEIKMLYSSKIEEQQATVITKKLPVISSYKSPVRQVFQNLISNSLKYCKDNNPCKIVISAEDIGTYWHFSITDNGIGIHKDYFDKIFIIFQRLHTKESYSGTGMGLAVTKKIIENLYGKIWVESVEGEGSVFHFTLPNN